jgi:hypothetical protein
MKEMMKRAFLVSLLGLFLAVRAWGQAGAPTPLTAEENTEIDKAKSAAVFADPSLDAEERILWAKFKAARDAGQRPGADVMAELGRYNTKLYAGMIKIDPKVEPLLERLDPVYARHQHP